MTSSRAAARLLVLLALVIPAASAASGAWTSFVRPTQFADVIAEADTVLIASRDAGLLRYTPSRREFDYTVREPNGLASNQLTALELDRFHRVWVGTRGAGASVLSTDRASWSLVNTFDGLPSDTVNVLVAHGDSVWIGTTAGLALWDGEQIAGVLPDGVNPSPFSSDFIVGVVPLGDSLWVGTATGVYVGRLSEGLTSWTRVNSGLATSTVSRLVSDGTRAYALSLSVVYRMSDPPGTWVSTGGIGTVRTLTGRRGAVLAATDLGLYRWSGAAWTALNTSLRSTTSSPFVPAVDETGRGYAAGRPTSSQDVSGTGLYRDPGGGGAWTFDFPPGPAGNNCMNLEVEGDRLYVATFSQGVARLRGGEWTCWFPGTYADTSSTHFLRPRFNFGMLADAQGYKWLFSWAPCEADTGSLDVLDDAGPVDRIRHVVLGPDPALARRSFGRASALDRFGGHWFGMDSPCGEEPGLGPAGLEYYRPDTSYGGNYSRDNVPSLASDIVWALASDRAGTIWVGTPSGLQYFKPEAGNPLTELSTVNNMTGIFVRGLAVYGDSLWVLTPIELRRYSLNTAYHGSYTVPAGPAVLSLRPMDVGLDGTLWLGTVNGVRAYHPGGDTEDFTTANSPLVNDDVRTIRVDRRTGVVWIATGAGISRYDPYYTPATSRLASLSLKIFPNPARLTGIGVPIRLSGDGASYRGEIYDLSGRRVQRFSIHANGRVVWDGRDESGELVRPGIYFLRAEAGGRSAVARIVVLR